MKSGDIHLVQKITAKASNISFRPWHWFSAKMFGFGLSILRFDESELGLVSSGHVNVINV